MPSKSYALNVIADITQYQRELAKIPGTTDKQASAAARALEKRMSKAQAAAAKDAAKAAKKGADSWKGAFKTAAALSITQNLKAAFSAVADFAQGNADAINGINDLSARTGVAADTITGLQFAFEGSGQSAGDVDGVLLGVTQKLAMVERGSTRAAVGFDVLGVATKDADGTIRSAEDVLRDTLKVLSEMEDPADRARVSMTAFGTSGSKLVQALGDTDSLEQFIAFNEKWGRDTGPAASAAAAEWERGVADLKVVMGGFDQVIEAAFGTDSSGVLDAFNSTILFLRETVTGVLSNISEQFGRLGDIIGAVMQKDWSRAKDAAVDFAKAGLTGSLVPALGDAWDATKKFQEERDALRAATAGAISSERTYTSTLGDGTSALKGAAKETQALARATADWQHQLAVLDNGEELVAYQDRLAEISAALKQGVIDAEQAARLRAAAERKYADQVKAIWSDLTDALEKAQVAFTDVVSASLSEVEVEGLGVADKLAEGVSDAFSIGIEEARSFVQAAGDALASVYGMVQTFADLGTEAQVAAAEETQSRIQEINDAIAASENDTLTEQLQGERQALLERVEAEKASALDAFHRGQDLAIAGVAFSTAAAIVGALAPPPIGLGFTAGTVAAIGVAATGAAQVGSILAQSPPAFFTGGPVTRPDEVLVTAHHQEFIQSTRGVANMGGPDVAQAFNSGALTIQDLVGGGGNLYLRHELVDRVVTESARMTGSGTNRLLRATRPSSWRSHHMRRGT